MKVSLSASSQLPSSIISLMLQPASQNSDRVPQDTAAYLYILILFWLKKNPRNIFIHGGVGEEMQFEWQLCSNTLPHTSAFSSLSAQQACLQVTIQTAFAGKFNQSFWLSKEELFSIEQHEPMHNPQSQARLHKAAHLCVTHSFVDPTYQWQHL